MSSLKAAGIRLDLSVFRKILEGMNNPQNEYPSILVAGTNGKGSICAMISSILIYAGFKVGLYTSPHLVDLRERIRLNGQMISRDEMAGCIESVKAFAAQELTYFEFLTAVAFLFFARKKVDIAVLEVGMGGRLDATNVVHPLISAISTISLEHSAYLGKTLRSITREKAGIIKDNGLCITAVDQEPVINILEETCRARGATLYRIGQEIKVREDRRTASFSYYGPVREYLHLPCPLKGGHQVTNAAVAVGMADILVGAGWKISGEALREGLHNTRWEGRLEVLRENPQVVLDGAHNPAGISALCKALKRDFRYDRLIVICAILGDKDFRSMIKKLAGTADVLIFTRPDTDRTLAPPIEMVIVAKRYCGDILIRNNPVEAMKTALAMAKPQDLICATGSLYLVGQIKATFPPST
ncbi:MAG: bifunctional folylpolyglutamate synthase/dihydrofolate synthase [Syntrophales bacterium]|nr:bifunctional folylpolyglutamate synthase/dihydrofolate synthase [Syntrophales bacterium]